jgi:DNA processing protein
MSASVAQPRERRDWLRLARADGVGPATFSYLTSRFGSASAALEALPDLARRGGRDAPLRIPSMAEAEAEIAAGESLGAELLISADPRFPPLLRAIDPPPPVLWTLGNPGLLNQPCIAMVGARIASASGQRFARDLAGALGEAGWVVVSGMARGIDSAAHQGALATGTVAVLAGGVNDIYPPENQSLYDRIVAEGCIVSERPIGHSARAKDFPRRNRIISGLSRGVIVVEAELRSGSLITARLAGEQGREVFAVPGSPVDPRARGANDLLRQGAVLVEDADDVLRVLSDLPSIEPGDHVSPATRSMSVAESEAFDPQDGDLSAMLETLLSPSPAPLDHLARATGAPLPAVMAALTELSLAGRAELMPGGLAARP